LSSPEEKNLETYDLRNKPRKINDYEYPAMEMQFNNLNNYSNTPNSNNNNIPNNKKNVSTNIYSPEYAKKLNIKERATTSVNIGMGGLMK
jgi:hypothetical protein